VEAGAPPDEAVLQAPVVTRLVQPATPALGSQDAVIWRQEGVGDHRHGGLGEGALEPPAGGRCPQAIEHRHLQIHHHEAGALPTAVPMGIMVGQVSGKPAGTGLASWQALKTGLASSPEGSTWRQLIGTAFLAGIGFTRALFIGGLAFAGTPFERDCQLAILIGSLLAAAIGMTILFSSKASQAPASS
jgi:hypothetical protein